MNPLKKLLAHFGLTEARLSGLLLINLLLLMAWGIYRPQELPVAIWKLNLIVLAGWGGYWVDRVLFPYARPHDFAENAPYSPIRASLYVAAQLRRAIIAAAAMIGVALGA